MADSPPPIVDQEENNFQVVIAKLQHAKELLMIRGIGRLYFVGMIILGIGIIPVCVRVAKVDGTISELSTVILSIAALLNIVKDVMKDLVALVSPSGVHGVPRRHSDAGPTGTKGDPVVTDATIVKDETKEENSK